MAKSPEQKLLELEQKLRQLEKKAILFDMMIDLAEKECHITTNLHHRFRKHSNIMG